MNRRSVLGIVGVGVASFGGCTAKTLMTDSNKTHRMTVESTDETPAISPVSLDVEMVRPTVTSNHTAQLRVTAHNESEDRVRLADGHRRVFSADSSTEDDPGLFLIPPETDVTKVPGCWRPATEPSVSQQLVSVAVDPGERETVELDVWGRHDNGAVCIPTRTFRFETTYSLEAGDGFKWGFSLSVTSES